MYASGQTDIATSDTVIELSAVSKSYTQRQRGAGAGLKQFFHPEYRHIKALNDVSFGIRRGEFVAYAGPNGAGKSTTFKLLCGMLAPDAGEVRTLSMDPLQKRIDIMRRTGVLFGGRRELWWDQPVEVSFEWKRAVWDIPAATYDNMLALARATLDIDPIMHTFARELSLGQRMRAELALMLLHNPELVLLDEPTLGLDVLSKQRMIDILRQLNAERGTTILVTSHDMDDLMRMARRVIMINEGRLAFDGRFNELTAQSGMLRRVTVTAGEEPRLSGTKLIERDGDRYTFEIDTNLMSMAELMRQLGAMDDIRDIESGKAPIEDVIANMYREWGTKKTD